ncbi:MAG TPA: hypothetical protein VFC19_54510 [Candidatus Limnocylindrales bacterium]|nr:hypothetical protein [Candidatus Limnocylindrales bacterium]
MRRRRRSAAIRSRARDNADLTLRGRRKLVLRGGLPLRLAFAVAVVATVTAAIATGYPLPGLFAAAGLFVAWLVGAVRVRRAIVLGAGPPGDGPPGGAGVREPRRPRPHAPAGAAQLPSDDGYPGRAVAILGARRAPR